MVHYKKVLRFLSSMTLMSILIVALLICAKYNEYNSLSSKIESVKDIMNYDTMEYIDGILTSDCKIANNQLTFLTRNLHQDLLQTYDGNMEQLEEDLRQPLEDSVLSHLLDRHFKNVSLKIDNKSNKLFVSTVDNILWINTDSINSDDGIITWDDFTTYQYNPILADKAYMAIKNMNIQKNKYIFWQVGSSKTEVINMDLESLYRVYKEEGINGLKKYEMMIPMYITDDGDIFGTSDFNPLGRKNDNYKIIIVQRINLFDALDEYSTQLKEFENQYELIEKSFEEELNSKVIETIELILFSIFLFVVSGSLQNRIVKKYNIE